MVGPGVNARVYARTEEFFHFSTYIQNVTFLFLAMSTNEGFITFSAGVLQYSVDSGILNCSVNGILI